MGARREAARWLCMLAFLSFLVAPLAIVTGSGLGDEGEGDAPQDAWRGVARRFLDAEPKRSGSDSFLHDLSKTVASGRSDAAVLWSVEEGLVTAATEVLAEYRATGAAELVASGYLDMAGNVWGAILMTGTGGVDVVVATCDEEDAESVVRVVRMSADGASAL